MPITTDILQSYRHPRAVLRRHIGRGEDEGRALAVLMGACLLIFIAQWPGLARTAYLDPSIPLDALLGAALMAVLFIVPLLAYGIAALSHLLARAFGGRGSYFGARMALFWSLLAVSPLMLFQGLVRGFIGPGPALAAVGLLVFAAFAVLWANALMEAERG